MKRQDKITAKRYLKKLEQARNTGLRNPFETRLEQQAAIQRAKDDFAFMVQRYFPHYADSKTPWFHEVFAQKVAKNPNYMGFCVWGRALAKSVVNNILLPFWLWIRGEPMYLVIIGNNLDRARQLLEDIRAELEANPQIIADFGEQHNPGNWEDGFFVTKKGFIGQALGMGQSVRGLRVKGQRPTHIVADDIETKDLLKNMKRIGEIARWIERDLVPTMDGSPARYIHVNNRSASVMVMTRLRDGHPAWDWNRVDAYDPVTYAPVWPEKYPPDYFKNKEALIGTLATMAEYNNQPHVEGEIFRATDIQWCKKMLALNHYRIIIGHWDIAYAGTATADYNAVVVQGVKGKDFYVIDTFCRQSKMREAVEWMCRYQLSLPKTVIVHWQYEGQFWNDEVERTIQEVEREFKCRLNIIKTTLPKQRKYDRILTLQPYYQNGRIFYNERLKSSNDAAIGMAQLYGIEPGYKTKDDWPDAHQAGIAELEKYVEYESGSLPILQGLMLPNYERL
ncbi:hypothetical protein LS482_16155 [Sinomicrobium kalidii]|uniref:phage terminase large subunit family protein n=1 Tax=Sinomicrobium kalidii TaxID=2900738 RepID=UPI001E656DA7|nr:hypothetical protein [Sinomicrobium kalidii]UGU15206.1 hypothetical protein LS482_16155 [Sinomicrobium kalidii]